MTEEYVTKEQDKIPNQKITGKEVDTQVNLKSSTPRHNVIKMHKKKKKEDIGKFLKATREKKQDAYKGIPTMLLAEFSTENLQSRRDQHDISRGMKENTRQTNKNTPKRTMKNMLLSKAIIRV